MICFPGLQLTKALLSKGYKVLAGARNPPDALKKLQAEVIAGDCHTIQMFEHGTYPTSVSKTEALCYLQGMVGIIYDHGSK